MKEMKGINLLLDSKKFCTEKGYSLEADNF